MNNLEEARKTIDEVDQQMAELFEKRFQAVREVIAWKLANDKPIYDPAREEQIRDKNTSYIKDEELRPYYAEFFTKELELSRKYQQMIKEKQKS
jgi:monofunctional chorismate mutase